MLRPSYPPRTSQRDGRTGQAMLSQSRMQFTSYAARVAIGALVGVSPLRCTHHERRSYGRDGVGGARLELKMSTAMGHEPSGCRRRISRYLPVSTGAPATLMT